MTHPDPGVLLAAVASALNACERAGITVDLDHGAVTASIGFGAVALGSAPIAAGGLSHSR